MWLLKATGDPNRKIRIGFDFETGDGNSPTCINIPLSCLRDLQLVIWKALRDAGTKNITTVSQRRSISVAQSYRLLDWLDKVRIGMWLGYYMLQKKTRS